MRGRETSRRKATGSAALARYVTAALLSSGTPHLAHAADEPAADLTPYDAGYASQAATGCPGLTLVAEPSAETKADPDFKRGQDMFKRYVETMKIEGACTAALKLYDARTGKVAKVLRPK